MHAIIASTVIGPMHGTHAHVHSSDGTAGLNDAVDGEEVDGFLNKPANERNPSCSTVAAGQGKCEL